MFVLRLAEVWGGGKGLAKASEEYPEWVLLPWGRGPGRGATTTSGSASGSGQSWRGSSSPGAGLGSVRTRTHSSERGLGVPFGGTRRGGAAAQVKGRAGRKVSWWGLLWSWVREGEEGGLPGEGGLLGHSWKVGRPRVRKCTWPGGVGGGTQAVGQFFPVGPSFPSPAPR